MANMKAQARRLGLAHDERRGFATTDDDFVKWTQWIFLQIFNSWYDPEAQTPGEDGTGAGPADLHAHRAVRHRSAPHP